MRRPGIAVLAALCACAGRGTEGSPASAADSLVGTWRVVAHLGSATADSARPRPFGARPRGYLSYDRTGHVLWQVQRSEAADSLGTRSWREAPDSLLRALLDGFAAYFGTYAVDATARLVTHHIEGEFLPRSGQVERATPFRLSRDSLILGADSLERWIFLRVR